jgi:thioredoxin-related protein
VFLFRHALICLLLFFSPKVLFAQADPGIHFIDVDYSAALKQAEKESKIIFLVLCHSLATPCINLQAILEDSILGEYYNDHFINISLDAESIEGERISKDFNVNAFPTYLFISHEGSLVIRGQGVYGPERLIDLGMESLNPDIQIRNLQNAYELGERNEEVFYNYASVLFLNYDTLAREVAREYLDSFPAWTTRNRMEMVLRMVNKYNDRYYRNIVEKRYLYIKEFGEGIVDGNLTRIIEEYFNEMGENVSLTEVKQVYEEVFPSRKSEPLFDYFEMNYFDRTGNTTRYIEKAKTYVKKYTYLSWSSLNELAWAFYEKVDDQSALKIAVKWARKSIDQNNNHYNNDTLAALYYKLGNQKKALKYAERAIELANAAGEDPSETERLLSNIKNL